MTVMPTARDYSLIGRDGRLAVETGLAAAEWYHTDIPRKEMKELMKREDGPAIRDTILWLALFLVFGGLTIALWPSWWAVLPLFAYGTLYGSTGDSRWHECGHGTAFKTRWMNDAVYQFACFIMIREPEIWRWSHTRHHTDTIIVGRDPEIVAMRPPRVFNIFVNFLGITNVPKQMWGVIRHAFGSLSTEEETFVPEMEWPKVYPHRPHLARDPPRRRRPRARARLLAAGAARRPAADDVRRLVQRARRRSPSTPASPRTCSTTG